MCAYTCACMCLHTHIEEIKSKMMALISDVIVFFHLPSHSSFDYVIVLLRLVLSICSHQRVECMSVLCVYACCACVCVCSTKIRLERGDCAKFYSLKMASHKCSSFPPGGKQMEGGRERDHRLIKHWTKR